MLKLGILIDASAEVPPSVLDSPHVRMLPMGIQIDNDKFLDRRNPIATRDFNIQYLNLQAAEVSQSVAPTVDEISRFLVDHVATEFDHVFGLFVASSRSPVLKNASAAASMAISDTLAQRAKMGIKGPLLVECYDSLNVLAGYGVQVMEALRQFDIEPSVPHIRSNMQRLAKSAYCYVAPSQLDFIVTRAKAKGDNSVGAFGKAAAKMLGILPILRGYHGVTEAVTKVRGVTAAHDYVLNLARRELARGLLAPFINVTYSGDIETVAAMPAYNQLCTEARAKDVVVSLQETSPSGSINLGPNALGVGFIALSHEPAL